MAPRPFWKGYLKLSLVTCAVSMTPATSDSAKVRFHTINRATGNRVISRYVDAATGKPVDDDDMVKGYPRGEDDYVLLEDDELDAVALDSTRTINIETFVPADSIGWIWYDKPHFLAPDDEVGTEAFAVIRAAMEATKTVGIARLVLYRRERAVMLEPRENGIVLWTLRYGDEVRDAEPYFAGIEDEKPDTEGLDLMRRLIAKRKQSFDPALLADPVEERLHEMIAARSKTRRRRKKPVEAEAPAETGNVINIMDALKRSLATEKKPAKRR
ncbi:DNA end-binding protein Ku [Kaistia soli DSM 19436]|uniref:Non-homologous end joining protein Ku n=1 Tax=Kaistia soli DSM 19436 TaxID=1122133 RepID=A0A1M5CMY3_9HYPH|nr:Ku protein [Kaistia soli]SHF56026.1 DNA end-binding protein Ku [Kaistia soli DSM 19436]